MNGSGWSRAASRRVTAWHEAGHAITATALGLPVRYVTLRPYGGGGRMMPGGALPKTWDWRDAGATCLAGIAAEQMLHEDRAALIWGGGADLHDARRIARLAIDLRDRGAAGDWPRWLVAAKASSRGWLEWVAAATAIDPGLSESGVGGLMWRHAVATVTEHLDAVAWLTSLLLASPRAVPGQRVREVYANSERSDEPTESGAVEWWIPRHTRMQWRTGGHRSLERSA